MQAQTIIQTRCTQRWQSGLELGCQTVVRRTLFSECDETLYNSIVISVAYPALAVLVVVFYNFLLVFCSGELAALMGVMLMYCVWAAGTPVAQLVKHAYRVSSNFRLSSFLNRT